MVLLNFDLVTKFFTRHDPLFLFWLIFYLDNDSDKVS